MFPITCFVKRFLMTDEITDTARKNEILKDVYIGSFPANVILPSITEKKSVLLDLEYRQG